MAGVPAPRKMLRDEIDINTVEYLRLLATRLDTGDRIALTRLADQLEAAFAKFSDA